MTPRILTRAIVNTVALTIGSATLAVAVAQTGDFRDAESILRAAFERYNATWYHSLTFLQQTIQYSPDGSADTTLWYEAYEAPGRLRIDVAPLDNHTMFLFANDSFFVFQRDTLASAKRMVHPLLLLGFDLYFLPPHETVRKLKELGFNMSIVHNDRWLQRNVIVVGAPEGDSTSAQFWIDTERLVLVRIVMPFWGRHQVVLFNRYQKLSGGWIAPEVIASTDGRTVLKELYNDIHVDVMFDQAFFDSAAWRTARHWYPDQPH